MAAFMYLKNYQGEWGPGTVSAVPEGRMERGDGQAWKQVSIKQKEKLSNIIFVLARNRLLF